MVEKSAEGILLFDPGKGIQYASPSVQKIAGYTAEEPGDQCEPWCRLKHLIYATNDK